MNPAFSVIFLTTLIGAGQGLFLALMTAQTYSIVEIVPIQNTVKFYGLGALLVLLLLVAGLVASIFHLGHPERAWRSAAMWRTSWLSREVIALPLTMILVFVYGVIHYFKLDMLLFDINGKFPIFLSFIVGSFGVLAVAALFICTAMIYACIKFIQEWASPLTVINYVLFGLASGFTIAAAFAVYQASNLVSLFVGWAIVFTVLSAMVRFASLIRNHHLKPKSSPKTAIGLRHNKIKQISQGAMGGSFNTREYFHGKSEIFIKLIKWLFILLVYVIPLPALIFSFNSGNADILLAIAIIQYVGLIGERWFFFAQANHPQNIYYQST